MIRSFDGTEPQVAPSAYVDEAAVVTGDVVLEAEASVWPNATLRGDAGRIVVGEGSNVQDNAVMHEGSELGADVTVGHSAIVHAATVADGALIGMNAVVLDGARVGERAVVAAGSVVTGGTELPPETLATGAPAEVKTDLDDPPGAAPAEHYVHLAGEYERTSERLDRPDGGDGSTR
jgi:carbonic anhydrase/acetyltransferase-like protein (isoleucine patch superfamily)